MIRAAIRESRVLRYLFMAAVLFVIDRLSKWYVLNFLDSEYKITSFFSFKLSTNRGISWGMLQFEESLPFILLSLLIIGVTIGLAIYAYHKYRQGYSIVGEVLIITGALSNSIDRFLYGGVIDFIMIHKGSFVWPLFNIADVAIVVGVFIMAAHTLR